ncbi:MAG: hypothetical protein M3340_18145, partial [Actinomycetota bacterium]|nr:hypothetical protein [Actinomycetota bacterium]
MRRAPIVLLLAAALLGGCGDDDEGDRTPKQELEALLPDYEKAVADQDCEAFTRFVHSAVRAPGKRADDPPDPRECSNFGVSYTRLEGFEAKRTKVFGSAAIVEGHVEGRLTALIWTLDDGRWTQVQATPPGTSPQIQGQSRPTERYLPNAAAWVRAMRAGACGRVFRLLNPASPLIGERDDEREFCGRLRSARSDPRRLPAQLA